ncbi:Speckle-type POZ protein A [Aphelenchoides besseyi]|nr:Speckle-type POZ protein A [Aphelenchoides besseyi]
MISASTVNDPNVAVWRIDNYNELYKLWMDGDEMVSAPFSFEHPTYGQIIFHLQFKPKSTIDPSDADLYMQLTDAPVKISMLMECNTWIETFDELFRATDSNTPTFECNSDRLWLSAFSAQQKSEFFRSPTIFICLRMLYDVKSIASISNSTLYRWNITDFELRWESAKFQTAWESDEFVIPKFKNVKFAVQFYPKGDREDCKDRCAVYLIVKDFAGYSKVPVQFEFWIENKENRLYKAAQNHVFTSSMGYGRPSYKTQNKIFTFTQNRPFDICCEVRSINYVMSICQLALDQQPSITSFFNDPHFSDSELHVDKIVFKVSKLMLSVKSPVFHAMFDKETEEQKSGVVKIKNFEASMVEKMLMYMYDGEVTNLDAIAAQLLPVADYYQVNALVNKCSESILVNLTFDNVLSALELAFERPHLEEFKSHVLKFVHVNFKGVFNLSECKDFLSQNPEIAIELLKAAHSIS